MLHGKRGPVLLREESRCLDDVLDLPSIELDFGERVKVCFVQAIRPTSYFNKGLPNMQTAWDVKRWVRNGEMNARLKCCIEVRDTIAGEKHDASVIFELA